MTHLAWSHNQQWKTFSWTIPKCHVHNPIQIDAAEWLNEPRLRTG
jgi:hypothetical protein